MNLIEFETLLARIVGMKIWKIKAGGVTGSVFTFEVGNQIINQAGIKIEGEFSFMIECAWRLEEEDRIITSWREDSEIKGSMVKGLLLLDDDKISNVKLSKFYDLELFFESGKRLFVFCDYTNLTEFDSNWFFRHGKIYYTVTNQFDIEIEDDSGGNG